MAVSFFESGLAPIQPGAFVLAGDIAAHHAQVQLAVPIRTISNALALGIKRVFSTSYAVTPIANRL
jgi:hypothetical protein